MWLGYGMIRETRNTLPSAMPHFLFLRTEHAIEKYALDREFPAKRAVRLQ